MKVRLNRFLSMCGIASRRKAEILIENSRISVNGIIIRDPAYKVDPDKDIVTLDGKVIKPERKRYIILNKPCCYLTALGKDKHGKKTIEELIKDIKERVYPVGRLDYNSEGLLLLTNDGELANRILHPRYKLPKVYMVEVKGLIGKKILKRIKEGTELEDGFAKPDKVDVIRFRKGNTILRIVFHEGRKHLVKRYLAKFGHPVIKLKRIAIGPIRLGSLKPGEYRDLTEKEISDLKKAVGLEVDREYGKCT